ncbi:MAG TPA: AAA family ATPase, partial [Polyangiaceae bacterium]|nr:AAA family ATPase [Polyangiaceae bacterium]
MPSAFVGRSEELSQARAALEGAQGGSGALLLFAGEAGIGKTRLADSVAAVASERGARVAWGRCWEAGGAPAYWPWIEIFRALGMPDDPFVSVVSGAGDAGQSRFYVFDSAVRRLTEAARQELQEVQRRHVGGVQVVQDDEQPVLTCGLRSARIALIGTYREAEARANDEVGPLLAKIAREGQALSLSRLTREQVAAWLALGPGSCAGVVDDVHRLSEGIPLFVSEILRLAQDGRAPEPTAGVLSLLDEHLTRLRPETRRALEAASVIGREFTPEALCELCSLSADDVQALLAEATTASVVHKRGERLSFSHMLLRDRLYDAIT